MASCVVRQIARFSSKQTLFSVCRQQASVSAISSSSKRFLALSTAVRDRFYTKSHEWVSIDNGTGTVGISHYAQEQLGEVVYVELPSVGTNLDAEEVAGCVESVKAASDIISPVAGSVTEVNGELEGNPQLVNSDPFKAGWLFKLELGTDTSTGDLMDESAYKTYVGSLDH